MANAANALARAAASASNFAKRFARSSLESSEADGASTGGLGVMPVCAPTKPSKMFLGKFFRFFKRVGIAPITSPMRRSKVATPLAIASIAAAASLASVPPPILANASTRPPPIISDALPLAMPKTSML